MSAARESKDIFFFLFGRWPNGQWRGRHLFRRQFWRYREYMWNDTIGRHINRAIVCPLIGHQRVQNVSEPREPVRWYCFACCKDVPRKGQ